MTHLSCEQRSFIICHEWLGILGDWRGRTFIQHLTRAAFDQYSETCQILRSCPLSHFHYYFNFEIMDEIAPEYDVVVLGTGDIPFPLPSLNCCSPPRTIGLTECVLSGLVNYLWHVSIKKADIEKCYERQGEKSPPHGQERSLWRVRSPNISNRISGAEISLASLLR